MGRKAELLRRARTQEIEVELVEVLDYYDSADLLVSDSLSDEVRAELAIEGVQLYRGPGCQWLLAPLDA